MNNNWAEEYRQCIVENPKRNKLIVDIVHVAYEAGCSIIVLVSWVSHLQILSDLLADIPHETVYGAIPVKDRIKTKKLFEQGKLKLLISSTVFKKGVDIKVVNCILDAAAGKSKNDAIQKFGRGVRMSAEKKGLVYVDISDSGGRFGRNSKARLRALKGIGIKIKPVVYSSKEDFKSLLKRAYEYLKNSGDVG